MSNWELFYIMVSNKTSTKVLAEHHLSMLKASGISSEIIADRGYYTETDPEVVAALGFDEKQCRVPALVIPVRDITGMVVLHRIRPDDPRPNPVKPGKVFKYESPRGSNLVLDIPTFAFNRLEDKSYPLWFTEGEKKADAICSQGEVAIGLLGVWAWKRYRQPLPEFDSIPLIGREVRIAFDSDTAENIQVRRALWALAHYLKGRIGDA